MLREDGVATLSPADAGRIIAAALEEANGREDAERYVALFSADTRWITSRGVLIVGQNELRRHLAQVMPGGPDGGSVSYRVATTCRAGDAVVVVIDQEYRTADGERKPVGGGIRWS